MVLQWLEAIAGALVFFAIIGVIVWLGFRGQPARKRYLHARSVTLRENARRVHEQQERLRKQQQQGGPPSSP